MVTKGIVKKFEIKLEENILKHIRDSVEQMAKKYCRKLSNKKSYCRYVIDIFIMSLFHCYFRKQNETTTCVKGGGKCDEILMVILEHLFSSKYFSRLLELLGNKTTFSQKQRLLEKLQCWSVLSKKKYRKKINKIYKQISDSLGGNLTQSLCEIMTLLLECHSSGEYYQISIIYIFFELLKDNYDDTMDLILNGGSQNLSCCNSNTSIRCYSGLLDNIIFKSKAIMKDILFLNLFKINDYILHAESNGYSLPKHKIMSLKTTWIRLALQSKKPENTFPLYMIVNLSNHIHLRAFL